MVEETARICRSRSRPVDLLNSAAPQFGKGRGNGTVGNASAFTINGAWQTANIYMMDWVEQVGGAS